MTKFKLILFCFLLVTITLTSRAFSEESAETSSQVTTSSEESETSEDSDFSDEDEFGDEFDEEFESNPADEVYDPFPNYNRAITTFNDRLYFWIVKPIANGYKKVMPKGGRIAVNRFFKNLLFPVNFINNVLQLKFKNAGTEIARFGINSTIGILGFGDPAQKWFDLEPKPEDFGQTLGYYGVGSGFYFVLPILGPSNLRDSFALIPDYFFAPAYSIKDEELLYLTSDTYTKDLAISLSIEAYRRLNEGSLHIGEYESLKKDALDYYLLFRDAYEQNRKMKIGE